MTVPAWRAVFVIALLLQCYALYRPNPPAVPTGLPVDKLVHVGLFAAVAAVGVLAGIPMRWLVIGLLVQAAVSELIQSFLPGRGLDFWDLVADVAGIGLGVVIGQRLFTTAAGSGPPPR